MSMDWVRKNYRVPAKRGARVEYAGDNGSGPRFGTIIRADGGRLRIRLDGDDWAGAYHPTWALRYLAPAPPSQGEVGS